MNRHGYRLVARAPGVARSRPAARSVCLHQKQRRQMATTKSPSSGSAVWRFLGMIQLVGVAIYAGGAYQSRSDKEFRKNFEDTLPYAKELNNLVSSQLGDPVYREPAKRIKPAVPAKKPETPKTPVVPKKSDKKDEPKKIEKASTGAPAKMETPKGKESKVETSKVETSKVETSKKEETQKADSQAPAKKPGADVEKPGEAKKSAEPKESAEPAKQAAAATAGTAAVAAGPKTEEPVKDAKDEKIDAELAKVGRSGVKTSEMPTEEQKKEDIPLKKEEAKEAAPPAAAGGDDGKKGPDDGEEAQEKSGKRKRSRAEIAAEKAAIEEALKHQEFEFKNRLDEALLKRDQEWQEKLKTEAAAVKERYEELMTEEISAVESAAAHDLKRTIKRLQQLHDLELREKLKQLESALKDLWEGEIDKRLVTEREDTIMRMKGLFAKVELLEALLQRAVSVHAGQKDTRQLILASQGLRMAIDNGQPLNAYIDILRAATDKTVDPLLVEALDAQENRHAQGVSSFEELRVRFRDIKRECRHAALMGPQGGLFSYLLGRAAAFISFENDPAQLTEGAKSALPASSSQMISATQANGILARTEAHLEANDLEMAVRELNRLQGYPKRLARDWLNAARARLEVQDLIKVVDSSAAMRLCTEKNVTE
eukprot:Clim_evm8s88 gene=Clim_evmTU8s88